MSIEPQPTTADDRRPQARHTAWCSRHHGLTARCRHVVGTAGGVIIGIEARDVGTAAVRLVDTATQATVEVTAADAPVLRELVDQAIARLGGDR